jgi:hypothetical protein
MVDFTESGPTRLLIAKVNFRVWNVHALMALDVLQDYDNDIRLVSLGPTQSELILRSYREERTGDNIRVMTL